MSKDIVGTWSWKPHDELPKDQVEETGFPTPTLEAVKFTADGRYVFVQRIPGYDSGVVAAGTPVEVPEEFHEWKGPWDITKGELDMKAGSTEDRWMAEGRKNVWTTTTDPTAWERSFEIVELKSHKLQLETKAISDFDRTFIERKRCRNGRHSPRVGSRVDPFSSEDTLTNSHAGSRPQKRLAAGTASGQVRSHAPRFGSLWVALSPDFHRSPRHTVTRSRGRRTTDSR